MEKGKFSEAFRSMRRLRNHDVQAARDMYYAFKLLEVEASEREGKSLWREFFLVKRNRRAAQSSFFVRFMQQFCGGELSNTARHQTTTTADTFSQCHRLLLHSDLPKCRLLSQQRTSCLARHRCRQLAVRNPCRIHDRHFRPAKLATHIATHDVPVDVILFAVRRSLVPDSE
jgi:hypothetical protein